jgi:flagellar biosynthetic protein FliP
MLTRRKRELTCSQRVKDKPASLTRFRCNAVPALILSELNGVHHRVRDLHPFLIFDLISTSPRMSMGMFMLPPVLVSLPFKLLLFVMVDGWALIVRSLITSFHH